MYCIPGPPPGSIRAPISPQFALDPSSPLAPALPPETLGLRENVVNQIEYYFRYVACGSFAEVADGLSISLLLVEKHTLDDIDLINCIHDLFIYC